MFFYLFHNLNHGLFRSKEKSDGATNVRTLILGSIFWVLFHVWANSQNMKSYFIKDYFWWFFLIDVFAMGIIYKLYYKRSIFNELKETDTDIYLENEHRYVKSDKLNTQTSSTTDTNINTGNINMSNINASNTNINNILEETLTEPNNLNITQDTLNPKPSITEYVELEPNALNSLCEKN